MRDGLFESIGDMKDRQVLLDNIGQSREAREVSDYLRGCVPVWVPSVVVVGLPHVVPQGGS